MIDNIVIGENRSIFSFKLRSNLNEIILNCTDRNNDLILGLTHELVEATIFSLIRKINGIESVKYLNKHIHFKNNEKKENYTFSIPHLIAVYSMELYSIQKEWIYIYEKCFNERVEIL